MKKTTYRITALIMSIVFSATAFFGCYEPPEEHTHSCSQAYSCDETFHWKECECTEKSDIGEHIGGVANCTDEAICETCGSFYGGLEPHSFINAKYDDDKHWMECICGARDSVASHRLGAVVTSDTHHWRECSNCGYKKGLSAHNSSTVKFYNDSTHWLACSCGYEHEAAEHILENLVCVCGYKAPGWDHVHSFDTLRCDALGHWYECSCKERTVSEEHTGGSKDYAHRAICEVCFANYEAENSHSYDAQRITATTHYYECSCGEITDEVEHVFENGVCECGYIMPDELHVHDFSILKYSEAKHWYECICKVSFMEEGHKGGNGDCETLSVCDVCRQRYGDFGHAFNDGELMTPATADTTGVITYTCLECGEIRNEITPKGTTVITRADLEEALVNVAWAYYVKGVKLQYDSAALSMIDIYCGGTCRHSKEASPEFGTSDTTIFSVCTGFAYKTYLETLDRKIWERTFSSNGINTAWLWLASDNQPEEFYLRGESGNDAITENDIDTAILRWIDYEAYLKKATAEELSDAERLNVYASTSFGDWYEDGTLEFKPDGEGSYSYYLNGSKIDADTAKIYVNQYIMTKVNGEYVNLRPGDLLTEDTHTLVYIGNGYVLDCNGYKYDIEAGVDDPEERGAIYGRMKTVADTLKAAASDYVITRPLDYYAKDYDGNPGNDIVMYNGESVEMTESTKSRQQYPAMDIDRTVDITPYGTVSQNDTLTYTIKITNSTTEANYLKWRKLSDNKYTGENYEDLVVSEKIPEGTVFVSAGDGYALNDGVLTWTIDVPKGNTVEISYTVKVTADVGSTITCDGGKVADIPSNSIANRVGYSKLSDAQQAQLMELIAANTSDWKTEYGADLDFAEGIYEEMGIELTLPSIEAIIENLFTPTYVEKWTSIVAVYPDERTPAVMYMPQENVSAEYEKIRNMIVDKYIGGYRLFTVDLEKLKDLDLENFDFPAELDNMIMECKFDYLEVGDILVYATAKNRDNIGLTSELSSTRVLVYAGNETFIEMSSDGSGAVLAGDAAAAVLSESFKNTNDIFFTLRPSQVTAVFAEE